MSEVTREIPSPQQHALDFVANNESQRLISFVSELDELIHQLDIAQQLSAELFNSFDSESVLKRRLIQRVIPKSAAEKKYARLIGNHVVDTNIPLDFDYKVQCLQAAGFLEGMPKEEEITKGAQVQVGDTCTVSNKQFAIEEIKANLRMLGADATNSYVGVCLDLYYKNGDERHVQQVALRFDGSVTNVAISRPAG